MRKERAAQSPIINIDIDSEQKDQKK
jgi:hypothetical protein